MKETLGWLVVASSGTMVLLLVLAIIGGGDTLTLVGGIVTALYLVLVGWGMTGKGKATAGQNSSDLLSMDDRDYSTGSNVPDFDFSMDMSSAD